MFVKNNTLTMRYAIYRTHLAEKHVNTLYGYLIERFPEDAEFLETCLQDWQKEVSELHDAFLSGDTNYLDEYERRFSSKLIASSTKLAIPVTQIAPPD